MRALLLVLVVLSAGCLAAPGRDDTGEGRAPDGADEPSSATFAFGDPVAVGVGLVPEGVPQPAVQASYAIEVPAGASRLRLDLAWGCTSLCKIEGRLHAPDGSVQAASEGVGHMRLEVAGPTAGTWSFQWTPGEGTTLGLSGEGTVTVTS